MTTSKVSVSPLKPKDEQLRKTVQGFKLVKLKLSQAEIAAITGISKGTAHNQVEKIQGFPPLSGDGKANVLNFRPAWISVRTTFLGFELFLLIFSPSIAY